MVIRNTILRVLSPERIRGRVASVNWVFIGASNELGAFESGDRRERVRDGAGRRRWRVHHARRRGSGRDHGPDPAPPRYRAREADRGSAASRSQRLAPSSAQTLDGPPGRRIVRRWRSSWPSSPCWSRATHSSRRGSTACRSVPRSRSWPSASSSPTTSSDPISITPDSEAIRVLAEATLTLLLFVDASTIRARALAHDIGPVSRLLVIGLPLTIVLGAVAALVLFPGMPLGLAVLIGATLAPTDAALSQAVISNQVVPARIRRLLNVESGLNDGIATPFVVLGIALSVAEGGGTAWLGEAVTELAVGVAVGLLLGFVGGRLLEGDGSACVDVAGVAPAVRARARRVVLPRLGGRRRERVHRCVRGRTRIREWHARGTSTRPSDSPSSRGHCSRSGSGSRSD